MDSVELFITVVCVVLSIVVDSNVSVVTAAIVVSIGGLELRTSLVVLPSVVVGNVSVVLETLIFSTFAVVGTIVDNRISTSLIVSALGLGVVSSLVGTVADSSRPAVLIEVVTVFAASSTLLNVEVSFADNDGNLSFSKSNP